MSTEPRYFQLFVWFLYFACYNPQFTNLFYALIPYCIKIVAKDLHPMFVQLCTKSGKKVRSTCP